MSFYKLPLCLLQYIFDFLNLKTQFKFKQINKYCYTKLHIKKINDRKVIKKIPLKLFDKLNPFILDISIYYCNIQLSLQSSNISVLNFVYNALYKSSNYITLCLDNDRNFVKKDKMLQVHPNLNHMTNLKTLKMKNETIVIDNIKDLDLREFYIENCYFNLNIFGRKFVKENKVLLPFYFLNCFRNLRVLHITLCKAKGIKIYDCHLKQLNLTELKLNDFENITTLKHMFKLKILICPIDSKISWNVLKDLNLEELYINCYEGYLDLNHMSNLKVLSCIYTDLDNNSICKLNLTELYIDYCQNITKVPNMSNLKVLRCNNTPIFSHF